MSTVFPVILSEHRSVFKGMCAELNLSLEVDGVDRHGSLVWEGGAIVGGLQRLMTLAFTSAPSFTDHPLDHVDGAKLLVLDSASPESPPQLASRTSADGAYQWPFLGEIWYGVASDSRSLYRLAYRWLYSSSEDIKSALLHNEDAFREAFRDTWSQAGSIKVTDLKDSYVIEPPPLAPASKTA